ncbi:hypothetical protein JS561_19400 [Salmonella enterica subsp. enterica serovar Infantis]|nr:hypothetical protein JS561_19400 [Salmonella enterica subsp. enterica serovar Infantis]
MGKVNGWAGIVLSSVIWRIFLSPFRSPQSAALMDEYSALPAVLSAPLSGCLRSDFYEGVTHR